MLFSILIPVYNVEEYLDSCVQSILNQSISDYEIILIDDNSTDGSAEICEKYAHMYPNFISFFRHEQNKNQLITRRELFSLAKGDWVICVDSDDFLANNALEILRNAIIRNDIDLVLYNLKCILLNGKTEFFKPNLKNNYIYKENDKKEIYRCLFENHYLNSMCTKAIKKEIIDNTTDYSTFTKIKMGVDLFQTYPIIDSAQNILYLDQELYIYRKNENGITSTWDSTSRYETSKLIWKRCDEYIKKWSNLLDYNILVQNAHNRVNGIFSCIKNIHTNSNYQAFKIFAETLINDGIIQKEYQSCRHVLRRRYKVYYKLLINKNFRFLRLMLAIENFALKMKFF